MNAPTLLLLFLLRSALCDECGRPSAKHPPAVRIKDGKVDGVKQGIAHGNEAEPHSFPWMVRIVTTGCGATVVGRQWVLTAAHCVVYSNTNTALPSVKMNIGAHDVWNSGTWVTSSAIYVHGSYTKACFGANGYDIALIKLPYALTFSDTVQPICLPDGGDKFTYDDGTKFVAAGWGGMETGYQSSVLMMTVMQTTYSECKRTWIWQGAMNPDTEFCGMGLGSYYQGTCPGDSGGPQFVYKAGRYVQAGLTSCGQDVACGSNTWAPWFTHVPSYVDWIKRVMAGGGTGGNNNGNTGCKDLDGECAAFAAAGECSENPAWMHPNCPKACGKCKGGGNKCVDKDSQCAYWASAGECAKNAAYMRPNCAKSCGAC